MREARRGSSETHRTAVFENVETIFERVKKNVAKRSDKPEFPMGITQLDKVTHGIRRGKVTVIAARPSQCKTALSLQIAVKIADAGKVVAFISLEDDREQIVEKIYCNMFRENNYQLLQGQFKRINDPTIGQVFNNLKLLVLDDFGFTFDEIQHVVEEVDPKPDIVFVDYIQIIDSPNGNRYEAINEFSRRAKIFSEKSDIGFVILSQINRQGAKDERPQLHHLSGSDTLEQTADLVLLLHYPFLYGDSSFDFEEGKDVNSGKKVVISGYKHAPKNWIEIEVAKNKTGERGVIVPVKFTGKHYLFEDWDGKAEEA